MADVFTLVGTFLAGGCCVMLVSAIVLVVWVVKYPAGPLE